MTAEREHWFMECAPNLADVPARVRELHAERDRLVARLTEIHQEIDALGFLHPQNRPLGGRS